MDRRLLRNRISTPAAEKLYGYETKNTEQSVHQQSWASTESSSGSVPNITATYLDVFSATKNRPACVFSAHEFGIIHLMRMGLS
jgi:hypothetical protein